MRIALILLIFFLFSCSSRSRIEKPFYYRVQTSQTTYHILGTMHVGFDPEDLPPAIMNDFRKSDVLMVESDPHTMKEISEDKFKKNSEYVRANLLTHFPELQKKLTAETWKNLLFTLRMDEVQKKIKVLNIQFPVTEIHPTLVSALTKDLVERSQEYAFSEDVKNSWKSLSRRFQVTDRFSFMDLKLMEEAKKLGLPVFGLDSKEDTFRVLGFLRSKEREYLDAVENFYCGKSCPVVDYEKLREAYRSGNESMLLQLNVGFDPEEILYRRNRNWYSRLSSLGGKNVFIAVGALHLVGEKNFLSYFEQDGFKVERISYLK